MAQARKKLDVRTIESFKPKTKPYRVSDSGGLLLEVRPTGSKAWLCRLTVNGKRRDVGLGGYPVVTLAAARQAAAEAKKMAQAGSDPVEQKAAVRSEKANKQQEAALAAERTFKAVAELYIESQSPGWKNPRTAEMWRNTFASYVYPELGNSPIASIDRHAIFRVIEPIRLSRPATSKKVLQRIGAVLSLAAARGWRLNDNPADTKMLRYMGLPALPGGKNQPSLQWNKAPDFWQAVCDMPGIAPLALRFLILTVLRSNEVREARWSWVSFDGAPTLTIPGEHMKGKKSAEDRPHRVPLSPAALDVLGLAYRASVGMLPNQQNLPTLAAKRGSAFIFPSRKNDTPLSDMALSEVMRRMNLDRGEGAPLPWRDPNGRGAVPHGWRATFRTWVDDTRQHDKEAAEKALAHEDENKVAGAYRRSDMFEPRVALMKAWADYCTNASEKNE